MTLTTFDVSILVGDVDNMPIIENALVIFFYEFELRCSDAYSDTILGYANCIRTIDGGTHIDGMKASLTRALNNLGKKSKIMKVFWVRIFFFLFCASPLPTPNTETQAQRAPSLQPSFPFPTPVGPVFPLFHYPA